MNTPTVRLKPPPNGEGLSERVRRTVWLASAPGQAWQWKQWAKAIPADHRHSALAKDVQKRAADIFRWYRKGANDYANRLVAKLDTEMRAVLQERVRVRKPQAKAGNDTAKILRERAEKWQRNIKPEIRRLLRAGEKDSKIADQIVNRAIFDREPIPETRTVRDFVAKVRKGLA